MDAIADPTHPPQPQSDAHVIAAALAAWSGRRRSFPLLTRALINLPHAAINLTSLQKTLDTQGLEIVENQKESASYLFWLSDFNLVPSSTLNSDFRKYSDEEKLREFKTLLKAYQQEIDAISKRSKTAEQSFLSLYKHLAEAPDPAPILDSVTNHFDLVHELEVTTSELQRSKALVDSLREELREGKAGENLMTSLKARLSSYEAKLDEMVAEKVAIKEAEIKRVSDEKIRIFKETEYSLQRQLNLMKDQLSHLQSNHEVTQAKLVDYSSQYDQEVAGKLGELEIVVADLERVNQKLASANRENDLLKGEIAAIRGETHLTSPGIASRHDWEEFSPFTRKFLFVNYFSCSPQALQRKIKAQDIEISKLLDDLNKCKARMIDTEAVSARRVNELERELAVKKLEIEELREKLMQFDDYDRVKRELDLLKQAEFPINDENTDSFLWDASVGSHEQSLEGLLIEKNKRLTSEISVLKDSLDTTKADLGQAIRDLDHFKQEATAQKSLIAKLEEDLYSLNNMSASSSIALNQPPAKNGNEAISDDPLRSINVKFNVATQKADTTSLPVQPTQTKSQASSIADLRASLENLKNDNVKLFEKLRFAESFSSPAAVSSSQKHLAIHIPGFSHAQKSVLPINSDDDVQARYRPLYESRMDPFQRFHKNEQVSRMQRLNPAEKAALMLTRLLVGNKYTRIGFVVYSVMLHLLVFATLYLLSQWEECRHDHAMIDPAHNVN
ncbi:hypothetical protein HDU82_006109 [Entophlyctis luteolus]|nr:hypothetical protein HDU82_006109 [Entophlyctis luteolus]